MKKTNAHKKRVKPPKNRRTFYLPPDVDAWIEKKSGEEFRSASNYIVAIIRREMENAAA